MAALSDLLGPTRVSGTGSLSPSASWFLTHDPVYAHELRRVWLWNDWPDRWGGDAGIDLVAEDRHGHLWAIQAKAYGPSAWITKRDVGTQSSA
jgi:predicted helicase